MVRDVRERTGAPFGVDFVVAESARTADGAGDLSACREEGVGIIVFHMDTPPAAWVRYAQAGGALVWKQVASVEEARAAVAAGVDGLIAQGAQSGGHCRAVLPLDRLLPAVAEVAGGRLVLAAGGIADGRSAARALAAGADGVWVGTRLLASWEANAHREYQRRVVAAAGPQDTVVTTPFGPEQPGEPLRCLRNRAVTDPVRSPEVIGQTVVAGQPYLMPRFSAIPPTRDTEGDVDEMCLRAASRAL